MYRHEIELCEGDYRAACTHCGKTGRASYRERVEGGSINCYVSFRCRHCSFYKDERGQGFDRYIPRADEGLFALALNARIELAKAHIGLNRNHSLSHDYAYAAGYQNSGEPVPALLSDPYLTDAFLYGQDQRRADDAEDTADRFNEMMKRLTTTA